MTDAEYKKRLQEECRDSGIDPENKSIRKLERELGITTKNNHPQTGALPPPGLAWQMGKTAGSILFVGKAMRYLETLRDKDDKVRLLNAIEHVKTGIIVITEELSPEEHLRRTKNIEKRLKKNKARSKRLKKKK